uniref:adenylate kinase n=1 Tax=Aegilops tauschii TaxID=37682 RepID=M8CMH1_AEGTA
MGRPGPQKHAHAARLAEVLAVPYISMGTLVRQELSPTSSLYKKIANSVNEGKLVPEDIIFGLLTKRLEEGYYKGENGFILDGIPRTRMQAEILDEIVDIDLVLNFKCADNCFMKKRSGGDICSHCGQHFGVSSPVSRERNLSLGSSTWPAQAQHASVIGLENPRMEKMRAYAEQTKQLEDYYKKHRKLMELKTSARPVLAEESVGCGALVFIGYRYNATVFKMVIAWEESFLIIVKLPGSLTCTDVETKVRLDSFDLRFSSSAAVAILLVL